MLKVEFVRDGKNQLIGGKTTGFSNGDEVPRGRHRKALGHSSSAFGNTRDAQGSRAGPSRARRKRQPGPS